jgi:rhodanese-related sulfurtransferase
MDRYIEFILNHYILSLAVIIVVYLLIQDLFETVFRKFTAISPLQAVTKMNDEDTVVIDVREPLEFAAGHIENARNTPLSTFSEELAALQAYKKSPLLVACLSGNRASSAARQLSKAGFENVAVITGGMQAWENDYKLPVKISKKKPKN